MNGNKIIILDPGHGGRDPGAVDPPQPWQGDMLATGEDEIAYDIAIRAARALGAAGYTAHLTRGMNQYISLAGRCEVANRLRAAAFVSVHVNAAADPRAAGIETFSYPGAARGARLRDLVHHGVIRLVPEFTDRGTKVARHYVTHYTKMPACLVECGFATNPDDEKRLHDPAVRDRIAQGIAQGVVLFLGGGS